jgi:hypothetical protein
MRPHSVRFVICNEGLRDFDNLIYEFVWLPASLTDRAHIPCKTSEPLFQSLFGVIASIFRWSRMILHFVAPALHLWNGRRDEEAKVHKQIRPASREQRSLFGGSLWVELPLGQFSPFSGTSNIRVEPAVS